MDRYSWCNSTIYTYIYKYMGRFILLFLIYMFLIYKFLILTRLLVIVVGMQDDGRRYDAHQQSGRWYFRAPVWSHPKTVVVDRHQRCRIHFLFRILNCFDRRLSVRIFRSPLNSPNCCSLIDRTIISSTFILLYLFQLQFLLNFLLNYLV